jgi:uncharacterized protein (UPF0332 family)
VEPQRGQELWAIAVENIRAARLAAQRRWYNVSAGRSYYAAYTAMWLALGDPPRTRWQHEGIVRHFMLGQCQREPMLLSRDLRKALSTLYKYRLKADYHGCKVVAKEAREALATAVAVLTMVAAAFALPQRGLKR